MNSYRKSFNILVLLGVLITAGFLAYDSFGEESWQNIFIFLLFLSLPYFIFFKLGNVDKPSALIVPVLGVIICIGIALYSFINVNVQNPLNDDIIMFPSVALFQFVIAGIAWLLSKLLKNA